MPISWWFKNRLEVVLFVSFDPPPPTLSILRLFSFVGNFVWTIEKKKGRRGVTKFLRPNFEFFSRSNWIRIFFFLLRKKKFYRIFFSSSMHVWSAERGPRGVFIFGSSCISFRAYCSRFVFLWFSVWSLRLHYLDFDTVVGVPLRKSREVEVRRKMKKWGEAEVNGTDERGEGEKSTRRSICSACILLVLFGSLLHILFLIVCVWFLFLFFLILSFSECREFCISNVECVYCLPVRSTVRVRCFVRISYEIYDPERAKFSVWLGVEKWLKFVRIYRKQLIKSRGKRVGRNTAKGNLPRCV